MSIKSERPLDYTSQVWRGIDDKFPKKIHNATATSDGLMSAEDKAKLDSIDVQGFNQIYDVASWETDGLMGKDDKKKLDSIEDNANNYIHPNTPEIRHVTDEQIAYWNAKASTAIVTDKVNGLMSAEDKRTLDRISIPATQTSDGLMSKEDKQTLDRISIPATETSDGLMSAEDKKTLNKISNPSTGTSDGLMSVSDKIKLDGIEAGANKYVHPNNEGIRHVSDAQIDYWNSKANKDIVTNSENGLMSHIDKVKLDGIETGANNYIHPDNENMRHVTDEQIRKWSRTATTTIDGLMSAEDKKLLTKLAEIFPNLEEGGYTDILKTLVDRVDKIEETIQTAIYYSE